MALVRRGYLAGSVGASQRLPGASRERSVFRLEQAGWKRLLFLPSQTQRETSKAFISRRHKSHRAGEPEVRP